MNDATKILIKNFLTGQAKLLGAAASTFLITHHMMDPSMQGTLVDLTIAVVLGAAASIYAWWTSVGHSRAEVLLQKLTGASTTSDAQVVAAAAPPAPLVTPVQVAQAAAKVASALIVGILLLTSPHNASAQGTLQSIAQRNDVNRPGGLTSVSPLVPGGLKTPDQLISQLQQVNLADFKYALAKAKASSNNVTQACWQGWVNLLTKAQTPLLDEKGQPMVKPDPHIFSDLEDASELIQSLQPGGEIQVGCAALADATKKSVANIIGLILGGGGIGGLLPVTPLLPIP